MDPTSLLDPKTRALLTDYLGNPAGAAQIAVALAHGVGAQSLGGYAGLKELLLGHGVDAAADAVQGTTEAAGPHSLGDAGIKAIQAIAPAYRAVAGSPVGDAARAVSGAYGDSVQNYSDLAGRYLGPQAGAEVGAAGDLLPMMAGPGWEGKAAADAAPAVAAAAHDFTPVLEDGATRLTLAREAAANARRAEDGIRVSDVTPSDFAGRQAEHEGAVASRMREKPAYTTTIEAANDVKAPWLKDAEYPDDAVSVTARDPETGDLMAHHTLVRRGGALQGVRMDTRPDLQGQGIGSDLLQSAISHAHDNDMDYHSDTQVSVPAMRAYMKHQGEFQLNPDHEELLDDADGLVAKSSNGHPLVTIPRAAPANDATTDEVPGGSWIASQAYASGGSVDQSNHLADLLKNNGSFLYNPRTGDYHSADVSELEPHHAIVVENQPSAMDIHHLIMASKPLMDEDSHVFATSRDGMHVIGVAKPPQE